MRLKVHAGISEVQGTEHPATRVPAKVRPDERSLLRRSSEESGAGNRKRRPTRVGKNCSAAVRLTGMFFRRIRGNCKTDGPAAAPGLRVVRAEAVEKRAPALARGLQSTVRS